MNDLLKGAMMTSSTTTFTRLLPAETTVGGVRLRVPSLDRSLAFYEGILGFSVQRSGSTAKLFAGTSLLLELREVSGLRPAPRDAAGLYHFAILLPARIDLARFARHLVEQQIPFGQSDHTVSEALYFDDPDGNGIEVYADRPRATWPVDDGIVRFTGDPIDFRTLFDEIGNEDARWEGMPAGTIVGHIHLRVSDVERAQAFYERLGFEVTADFVRGASFVSAGGYHHHLGMNMWQSRGRPLAADDVSGLESFVVSVPDRESWIAAIERLDAEAPDGDTYRVLDPDGIAFNLTYRDTTA